MRSTTLMALAAATLSSTTSAVYQGFNYGSTFSDGSVKAQSDFENEFNTAKGLAGTNGRFSSARLYTMIQGGTTNTPISALQAAIDTDTSLLLGMWASAGDADFANEIAALQSALSTYGSSLTNLVAGISVGSEDLYRISPVGLASPGGVGASPSTVAGYIAQTKAVLSAAGVSLPVGHVDTWTSWVNTSNSAVLDACDFLGMDAYPYYQNTVNNDISNAGPIFWEAYDNTTAAPGVGTKPVWITETGWPVSGDTDGNAVASVANAETYWKTVACSSELEGINTWWFTLQDSYPTTPDPSFGVVGTTLSTTPLYDLSC